MNFNIKKLNKGIYNTFVTILILCWILIIIALFYFAWVFGNGVLFGIGLAILLGPLLGKE